MIKKKKAKRKGLKQEDTLRAFITAQLQDTVGDLPSADKAQLVETIAALFGPSLVNTTRAAILLLTEEEEDEETEEDDEDEDDGDEDEDDGDDEDYEDDE